MRVINLSQRTEMWCKWRHEGMSASSASILLDLNPYKTTWRLWAELTGKAREDDLSKNPNVIRGFALEDNARQCCERVLEEDFLLPVCGESDKTPLVRASFDGVTCDTVPTELKCPSQKQYEIICREREHSEAYQLYYPQVQQQIYVADAEYGWLLFYSPEDDGKHVLFRVERDEILIKELLGRIDDFWGKVVNNIEPKRNPERDIYMPSGDDIDQWIHHATDYRLYDQQISSHEKAINDLKAQRERSLVPLKEMMGDYVRSDFAGVGITLYESQGPVDVRRMIEEEGIPLSADDMDKYRKPGATRCRVTVRDEVMPRNIIDESVKEQLVNVPVGPVPVTFF